MFHLKKKKNKFVFVILNIPIIWHMLVSGLFVKIIFIRILKNIFVMYSENVWHEFLLLNRLQRFLFKIGMYHNKICIWAYYIHIYIYTCVCVYVYTEKSLHTQNTRLHIKNYTFYTNGKIFRNIRCIPNNNNNKKSS